MADNLTHQEKELQKELKDEPGLTVAPPQLTLQEEPIPNPALDKEVEEQKSKA